MSLTRKFTIIVLGIIFFIALINIVGFYIFYSTYLKVFLAEKISSRSKVSLDYINSLVLKQGEDDVDTLFDEVNISFFEKLGEDNIIKLDTKENVDIVINYLLKSGVAPKYIEEVVPTNNFEKVLDALKDPNSPEFNFIKNIFISIIIINLLSIVFISIFILFIVKKTIIPIREATRQIKALKPGKNAVHIEYKNQDEVGLLIRSINDLNAMLVLQEKIRSKLLADISHELKTPITSIQCYLEGISDGVITLNEKNLASITSEMQRLIKLVNEIMKYEQFENKTLDTSIEKHNLSDILKSLVETHKKVLKEHNQRVKISGDENHILPVDKDLFIQLSHNLIANFLKYSGKKTLLTINVTSKYIDFSDNGLGIKQSEIPFLTEKFYQGNASKYDTPDERGIGVGLSIVGKIIHSHKWSFKISSDINKGFSFKIFF